MLLIGFKVVVIMMIYPDVNRKNIQANLLHFQSKVMNNNFRLRASLLLKLFFFLIFTKALTGAQFNLGIVATET